MGISTHILDTALGRAAAGISVTLAFMTNGLWAQLNDDVTDADGRCLHLLPQTQTLQPGLYRMHFKTASYYQQNQLEGLYPYIEIVFTVSEGQQHYHIPLLLTANGYTTYRGS
jgi:5-hydroxyisourate hydrolase